MRPFLKLLRRLRALFKRDALDREMDAEMRFHLEMQASENTGAGVPPKEAVHLARRQFGHVDGVKETVRERRSIAWFEQTDRDVRFAARSLRRSPGFTAAVIVTLAIAIGTVTAIVNVSRQVLLPDLPYPESHRLVVLREKMTNRDGYYALSTSRSSAYAHSSSFAAFGVEMRESLNLVFNNEPHAVVVSRVTPDYFRALDVGCNRGRLFQAEEHVPGVSGTVAIITHQAWTRFFNRDPSILGADIVIGDQPRRIVGILPERFRPLSPNGPDPEGIYLPTLLEGNREQGVAIAVGRLKRSVSIEQAQAELRTIKPDLPANASTSRWGREPFLLPLADAYRERRAQPFRLFLGAAGLLFLIGCTAVANLVLTRTMGRRRELGVRLALGGGRRRIMTLMFMEAGLLAGAGAALGTLIAWWSQWSMANLLPEGFGSGAPLHRFDVGTITIATLLGVITCVLAGAVPAWRAGRTNLNESLKEGPGALGESRRLRFVRGTLVAVQSALAVALLIGAGLMIESVHRLQRIDLGFDPTDKVALIGGRHNRPDREILEQHNREIVDRLANLPGIGHAAQTSTVPVAGYMVISGFNLEGREDPENILCYVYNVSPGFFATMGLPMIAGSGFSELRPADRPVTVIDEVTAREIFPGENPIGRFLIYGETRLEIVGVVPRVAVGYRGTSAIDRDGNPISPRQLYVPIWQSRPPQQLNVILQVTRATAADFASTVRQAVYDIDPSIVAALRPFAEVIDEATRAERHTRTMLQILSALALLLAAFGLFSVMAYTVTQRRGELGLRMVLGATPGRLVAFVLQRGVRLTTIGIVFGIGIALALARLMGSLLYETSPYEPEVYVGVAVLLLVTAIAACWLPARRAAKIDPAVTLRTE